MKVNHTGGLLYRLQLAGIFAQSPVNSGELGIYASKCPARARFGAYFRRERCLSSRHGEWKRLEQNNDRQKDGGTSTAAAGLIGPGRTATALRRDRHRSGRRRSAL